MKKTKFSPKMKNLVILTFLAIIVIASSCGESTPKYRPPIVISLVDVEIREYWDRMEYAYHVNVHNIGPDELHIQLGISPKKNGESEMCMYGMVNYYMAPGQDTTMVAGACGTDGPPIVNQLLANLREVTVNGNRVGIQDLDLSTVIVENVYPGVEMLTPGWSGLGPPSDASDFEPMSAEDRAKIYRQLACSESKSKRTVQSMCDELNYGLTNIMLYSSNGCQYQWLIQGIEMEHNVSFDCTVTTDGSSGEVEIVGVECD